MLGFYSVDITIDDDGKPTLIEINGSNSGFDGFLIAYQDSSVQRAISAAFREFTGERNVYVVTQLVNLGELPAGYLDKLVQDLMYFRSVENVHATLRKGTAGTTWARMRTDRAPSTVGAGTSLDALVESDRRFTQVALNVADPSYVIPLRYFNDEAIRGVVSIKDSVRGQIEAHQLTADDILWFRSPSLAYMAPLAAGVPVNPEFPYDAVADNKLFTYELLGPRFAANIPASLPVGNRCSGAAAVEALLASAAGDLFIRKPLLGSQARGIEIFRRQDITEYATRLKRLEGKDGQWHSSLLLELRGVPDMLATWVLRYDISLLSEMTLSRPILCQRTGREHVGCMRTLALVRDDGAGKFDMRFLGGYWRLAAVPIDGDGLLWERFIGSQSQGAYCEPVAPEEMAIAERFAGDVLREYCGRLASMPQTRAGFQQWENAYWLARYRQQVPALRNDRLWAVFLAEIAAAEAEAVQIKQQAEAAGFRTNPAVSYPKEQISRVRLPYLIKDAQRIVVR